MRYRRGVEDERIGIRARLGARWGWDLHLHLILTLILVIILILGMILVGRSGMGRRWREVRRRWVRCCHH